MIKLFKRILGIQDSKIKAKFFPKPKVRERLKLLYWIETDQAKYFCYNTQTIKQDWVNIEIEEQRNNKSKIILEDKIFEDSWGTMGGQAFSSLVIDSRGHLFDYIKERNEFIIKDSEKDN